MRVYASIDATFDLLFVNVYTPFESNDLAYDDFCSVLMQIAHLTQSYHDSQLIGWEGTSTLILGAACCIMTS